MILKNSVLLKRNLELLLYKSIQKIYLKNFQNLSYNHEDSNYYIQNLQNSDPLSTGTINQVFDFNMIAEYYQIEISDLGDIFVSENQKKIEIYDWFYREGDTINKMTEYHKNYFKQFWR